MNTAEVKKFSVDQRNALVEMLSGNSNARNRALREYNSSRRELEEKLVQESAKTGGASALWKTISDLNEEGRFAERRLRDLIDVFRETYDRESEGRGKKINESKVAIQALGFDVGDEGAFSLRWGADKIRESIHEQIKKALGTEEDIHRKYDQAQAKVLKAEFADEGAEIVEPLL